MSPPPLVSIIIPAFNAEAVLAATLDSVIAQTHGNWKAIIVDDGSTDGTEKISDEFCRKDARFSVVHQKNAGVAAARNVGLAQAQGEWIAFLDADDIWMPQKLELQLKEAAKFPQAEIIFTNYFSWNGHEDLSLRYSAAKKIPSGNILPELIFHNLIGISSALVAKKLTDRTGEFDVALPPSEDWDFWLRCLETGSYVRGLNQPLLRYRIWEGNASGDKIKMAQANIRVLEKGLARSQKLQKNYRRDYERSLQIARGNLEFTLANRVLEKSPQSIRSAALAAWKHYPRRVKWLFWYFALSCPRFLGGNIFAKMVQEEIRRKW